MADIELTNRIKISSSVILYWYFAEWETLCYIQWKCRLWDYGNVTKLLYCFAFYEHSDCPKKVINACILRINYHSWHQVTHMWLIMGFRSISHAASYREKGASKRSYLNRLWKHNISVKTTYHSTMTMTDLRKYTMAWYNIC